MSFREKVPFEYNNKTQFHERLVEWIGDILYDYLPEHGYDVRDEQIYTAFQIADAICEQRIHLAEAGLGTGKTFAYLLPAILYARFKKQPVVVACASAALQEQLAGENGDIRTLSKLLDLEVDARMAKDPRQYICDVRVEEATQEIFGLSKEVQGWIKETKRGERCEVPEITDTVWRQIAWNDSMSCESCESRGYCKLVKAREHYRGTTDLIIVDHATFFRDLWSRKERILNGLMPILPNYSAVIFDEGHKIHLPAAMEAGDYIDQEEIMQMVEAIEEIQGAREAFMMAAVNLETISDVFFQLLDQSAVKGGSTERQSIRITKELYKSAVTFKRALDQMLLEMQIERELYFESISEHMMQAYEMQIERATRALNRFIRNQGKETIIWVDAKDKKFWVVPKNINTMLEKELFHGDFPVILTSATLSNHGEFKYFAKSLGITKSSHSSIGSPFELEEQVQVILTKKENVSMEEKLARMKQMIQENNGHALVLTNSMKEVEIIREYMSKEGHPYEIFYEDMGERGYLIRQFRENESSVLVGMNFWEGIDIPGESLTLVVIFSLPFPVLDPLIESRRKEIIEQARNPEVNVDYPEMGLKLKQGCGRLIRRQDDYGKITILDSFEQTPYQDTVLGALPENAPIIYYEVV